MTFGLVQADLQPCIVYYWHTIISFSTFRSIVEHTIFQISSFLMFCPSVSTWVLDSYINKFLNTIKFHIKCRMQSAIYWRTPSTYHTVHIDVRHQYQLPQEHPNEAPTFTNINQSYTVYHMSRERS